MLQGSYGNPFTLVLFLLKCTQVCFWFDHFYFCYVILYSEKECMESYLITLQCIGQRVALASPEVSSLTLCELGKVTQYIRTWSLES